MNPLPSARKRTLPRHAPPQFPQPLRGGLGGLWPTCSTPNPEKTTPSSQGQTGDLSLPVGRPLSDRSFDHKPRLNKETGKELPDSVRKGQRLTGMSGNQASLPLVGSPFKFSQHGQSGQWISELLPHTAKAADDMCIVNSMYTEAINHGPGVTFMQTGLNFRVGQAWAPGSPTDWDR